MNSISHRLSILLAAIIVTAAACQKTGTVPSVSLPVALTVVNAIPNSQPVIPVINTTEKVTYFGSAQSIVYGGYGSFSEYSPPGGKDTIYAVQDNNDTLDVDAKSGALMFFNVLNLQPGAIYSLFLTGADTSSPDYLFVTDILPYHPSTDSTVGIRFVNLSAGSAPISINLEGNPSGSEVGSLPYKGITTFKNYLCNSALTNSNYQFVFRDNASGDSLTAFSLNGIGAGNGVGLADTYTGKPVIFKNITIVIYGSESPTSNWPLSAMLIDNY